MEYPPILFTCLDGLLPSLPVSSYNSKLELRTESGKSLNTLLSTTLFTLPSDFYVAPTIGTISPPAVSSFSYSIGLGTQIFNVGDFTYSNNTCTDLVWTYSCTLSNGSPLPASISFT